MMGYGWGLGYGLGGWLVMAGWMLLMVAAVVLIAWLIARAVTPAGTHSAPRPPTEDAIAVLRMRFARGEITKDEFLAAKQTLESER